MNDIKMAMTGWHSLPNTDPEIKNSFGSFLFSVNGKIFTSNIDSTASGYRKEAYLPAYPLALWIAQSWWRLFYEVKSFHTNYEWDMSHCMMSAGQGFLWPNVWIYPQGSTVDIISCNHEGDADQAVKYIPAAEKNIQLIHIENSFADFIEQTIVRLKETICHNELHDEAPALELIWKEVNKERKNSRKRFIRKCEAALGFDPGEASEDMICKLDQYRDYDNENSFLEVLYALNSTGKSGARNKLELFETVLKEKGVSGQFSLPQIEEIRFDEVQYPWDIGRVFAKRLRQALGFSGKVSDGALLSLSGVSSKEFKEHSTTNTIPVSLGVKEGANKYRLTFSPRYATTKRFQLARYISDFLFTSYKKPILNLLVLSNESTYRQRVQRACAAEFLCPFDLIKERTDETYTDDSIQDTANYFGVSPLLVQSQIANQDKNRYLDSAIAY